MTSWGRWLGIPILLLTVTGAARGQELSTDFYPSEDELLEALRLDEITYEQYVRLRELARLRIDSTNLYLLDQIPNLSSFGGSDSTRQSGLEVTQTEMFGESWTLGPGENRGSVEHRYVQPLDEEVSGAYRTRFDWRPRPAWRVAMRLNRELSGVERFTDRSIEYRGDGLWRRIVLGNFTTRLGLGTAIGYRGTLLDYSDRLDRESLVYPDNGGYNGVYVDAVPGDFRTLGLVSSNRDSTHRVETAGLMVELDGSELSPRVAFAACRLDNRLNGARLDLPMVSFGLRHQYEWSFADGELNYQDRNGEAVWSGVVEGLHRRREAELRYALWTYGDRLVDVTSGSKAGALSRTVEIEEVGFKMSERRAGQSGVLLRSSVGLGGRWQLSGSLLYAAFDKSHNNFQVAAELLNGSGSYGEWQADYLGTWKERPGQVEASTQQRLRMEHRIELGSLRLRSFIAYTRRSDAYNFMALFTTARWETTRFGMIEFWSNIGRINTDGLRYWYAYCRFEQQWHRRVSTAVKLSQAYNREATDHAVSQLSLELRGVL